LVIIYETSKLLSATGSVANNYINIVSQWLSHINVISQAGKRIQCVEMYAFYAQKNKFLFEKEAILWALLSSNSFSLKKILSRK